MRLDDETWDALKAEAERREMTASDLLREFIREGLERS